MNPRFVPRREQPSLSSYVTKSRKYISRTQASVSRREYGAPPYHHPYKVDKVKGSWGALGASYILAMIWSSLAHIAHVLLRVSLQHQGDTTSQTKRIPPRHPIHCIPPFQPNGKPKGAFRAHSGNSRTALALTGARLRVGDNTGYV
ncbi:hypothetical protein BDN71DRAFT_1432086 [Pleurotus eryngii]|uniref:Uncharacterized protein n=1 Tax=Pleurotus eryngii TaxID=5323 RepID=A0A9P6DFP7_PLEER|nr:hypothetical protein BDN71DRAFT_1432086 [Pleurotus eryngii]